MERFGRRFQVRDKVIQTENDYDKDVFNGDVGIVERVDPVEQQVAIRFDDRMVKNLIYTGITRGKRQKKALGMAVRNDRPQRRYSGLLASSLGKASSIVNG